MWPAADLQAFCAALANGAIAAAPAEGVYGYVADPAQPQSLEKLHKLKARSPHKAGYILLLPDATWLAKLAPALPAAVQAAVETYWPCPQHHAVTLLIPTTPAHFPYSADLIPQSPDGQHYFAARVPATAYMQTYLQAWGKPLISTSLNVSGEPPVTHARHLPHGMVSLTLAEELSGNASRIFNPLMGVWLR
ncbi:MAG: Sua5/YciO/YrdC/YwlC family protein [Alphaproteobacteria bacterium]